MDIGGKKKKVNKLIEKGMHEVANMALNIQYYLKKNFSLLNAVVCRCSSKWVIVKYATTHNYPQLHTTTPKTTHHPQSPTTIFNHPKNHPQPPKSYPKRPKRVTFS